MTFGNFDGVHLGHQELIRRVLNKSAEYKSQSVVFTFYPHPSVVLFPEKAVYSLFGVEDQKHQLQLMGVDLVFQQIFTTEFAQVSAAEFLQEYVLKVFRPRAIIVGYDFQFGANRSGNKKVLQEFCEQNQIYFESVDAFRWNDEIVSSTAIRQHLQNGHVEKANRLLGRDFYISGLVEHGFKRGTQIGIPTANLNLQGFCHPVNGVYATMTQVGGRLLPSITNIGYNPTFENDPKRKKIETHIFNFDEKIYDQPIKVHLKKYLREEKKFASIEELKKQILEDMLVAQRELN